MKALSITSKLCCLKDTLSLNLNEMRMSENTHPVGCADSLVIDAIAFLRQQWGVPVAVVGLVVAHSERLWRVDACGGELSSKVVLRVQERGVLEVNGNWVAA